MLVSQIDLSLITKTPLTHNGGSRSFTMSHRISLSKSQCPSTPDERDKMSRIPYASVIGSIVYAMLCTRPDVSYALSITNRYQSDPGEGH